MKHLPVSIVARLVTRTNRCSLDELAKSGDEIQELIDWPCIRVVETQAPSPTTTQQPDVLIKVLEKLERLVLNNSSQHGSRQRPSFPKQSDSSSKHQS